MKERIEEILKDLVAGVDIGSTVLVDEGYITSITMVQLVSELGEAFGVKIGFSDISRENFQSVEAMVRMVEKCRK